MCGRIVYDINEDIIKLLMSKLEIENIDQLSLQATYNAPPGSFLPIIYEDTLVIKADVVEWGLVPTWDKERKTKFANARVETITTKNSFKAAFKEKRCIVPISGYYEWKLENGIKQPYYVHSKSSKVLTLAGVYDNNSFTIITTEAFGFMKDLHPRMPLTIDIAYWEEWLENKPLSDEMMQKILKKANDNVTDFEFHRVDRMVNNVTNNRKELIKQI